MSPAREALAEEGVSLHGKSAGVWSVHRDGHLTGIVTRLSSTYRAERPRGTVTDPRRRRQGFRSVSRAARWCAQATRP
jgi:hypothetical protein